MATYELRVGDTFPFIPVTLSDNGLTPAIAFEADESNSIRGFVNAGFGVELGRGLVIAVISGGDLVARCRQRLRYRRANAARATGNDSYSAHMPTP